MRNKIFLFAAFRCEDVDSLVAYIYVDGKPDKIDAFCGEMQPRPLMSNGPRLLLEFRGKESSRHVRGFKATYFFTESKFILKILFHYYAIQTSLTGIIQRKKISSFKLDCPRPFFFIHSHSHWPRLLKYLPFICRVDAPSSHNIPQSFAIATPLIATTLNW